MPSVLPGAPPTGGSNSAWGMVPQVPDPVSSANDAVTGDLANLPNLQNLAGQTNAFNTQQAINPYIANLPGYSQMVAQSSSNIGNLLHGQIPGDVLNLLGQQGAERGIGTGLSGSQNSNAAYMRALGLTSLGLQQQGEGELSGAIARTPVPQLFNTAQFMTTPGDEQAAQMQANIYAAAPNPNMQVQALLDLFNKFSGKFSGNGVTIDRGLGYGGGTGTNTGGAGPTAGASGGAFNQQPGRPGSTLNTGAIFGNQPGGGGGAGGMPSVSLGGGGYNQGWNQGAANSGVMSPDMLSGAAGGSSQLNDFNSPSYQWWNQQDPYSAMSGIDWGQPADWSGQPAVPNGLAQSTSPSYDWYNQSDPSSALSGINWGQPNFWNQSQPNQGVTAPNPVASNPGPDSYYDFMEP